MILDKKADITGDKTSYIKYRAFDNSYYKDMILELIKKYHYKYIRKR